MDDEQRAKVSQLLEVVIAADGVIKPEEREFVERAMARWKLPMPARLAPDRAQADGPVSLRSLGSATEALRSLDAEARTGVLALLVEAAVSDGELDPREHALLLAAGASLGVDATVLEERILRRLNAVRTT